MIGKILRGIWTHLQIAFNDNYTVEGFEKTNKKFELPANLVELDPVTKRQLTICNLFANQNLSIFEIVKVLDSSLHQVIPALIENGLIKERRRNRGTRGATPPPGTRGLSILPHEAAPGADPESKQGDNTAEVHSSGTLRKTTLDSLSTGGHRMAS